MFTKFFAYHGRCKVIKPGFVKNFLKCSFGTYQWECFEFDKFTVGTEATAKKLAELSGKGVTTIIGGGDSVATVEKVGVADASLELLKGKVLPGVDA
ncbi:putative phosphoglycerate kinase [Helianthus annuus]|nr:putative phosphoglycerate kinase [Helianthus annuus]